MGMYTELHFNAELRSDVPQAVIDTLNYMLESDILCSPPSGLPSHDLFHTDRWQVMLRMDSYYFDADTHSTLRKDNINGRRYLCIRCNVKNYCMEIEKFVDWITPYLDKLPGDFLGFKRYEETENPTLLYMPPGGESSG